MSMRKTLPERWQKGLVALLFVALLVVGMVALPGYGIPTDEKFEMRTLRYNLREYMRVLWGPDEEVEEYFTYHDVELDTLAEYSDWDHGVAALYPAALLLMMEDVSPWLRTLLWHGYIFLLFVLGCFALYSLVRRLFGSRWLGVLAVLLLYLSPRFFAEGHYNSKDTVMMALTLVLLWQGQRLMEKVDGKRALCFALAGVLVANQRVIGLFLFALVALFVLVYHIVGGTCTRRTLASGLLALVSFVGMYYLLTPIAWVKPWLAIPETLASMANFNNPDRWDGVLLFQGQAWRPLEQPLPWYYLLWSLCITTPLFILALALIGQVEALGAWTWSRKSQPGLPQERMLSLFMLLCTLLWLAPMAYFIIARPVLYDSWRHYQFMYGPLLVLAVYGIRALATRLGPGWGKRGLALVLAACLAWTGVGIVRNHPYQYAYYNLMAGDAEQRYDGDYWLVSVNKALEQLLEYPDLNPEMYMDVSGFDAFRADALPYEEREQLTVIPYEEWYMADYMLVSPGRRVSTNSVVEGTYQQETLERDFKELFAIRSYGHAILRVYERKEVMDTLPEE